MKILFVVPEVFNKAEGYTREDIAYIGFPSLSAAVIAALTPKNIEFEVVDESLQPFNSEADFQRHNNVDVVALSLNMTYKANRATALARQFKEMGKKVIWGGVHITSLFDFHRQRFEKEVAPFADAVVLEEAEIVWLELINDLKSGTLKKIYRSPRPLAKFIPAARHEVLKSGDFLVNYSVQATRGCPLNCEFCSVTSFNGPVFRMRPVALVAEEVRKILKNTRKEDCRGIKRFKKSFIAFIDDNIAFNKNYFAELCLELEKVKKEFPAFRWGGQCNLNAIEKKAIVGVCTMELADLMERSGCAAMFVGIESVSQESLKSVGKNFNRVEEFSEQIKKFHDRGIMITAGMIVGLDKDTEAVFDAIYEFLVKNRVELSLINILVPLPGTRLYKRLSEENRLIDDNWENYDGRHVVYRPKLMSAEKLEKGFFELWEALYSMRAIVKRVLYPAQIWQSLKNPVKAGQLFQRFQMNRRYGKIAQRIALARRNF